MIDLPAEQLAKVLKIVRLHVTGAEVFAFGSRVSGKAKKFSDLDLMIKTPAALPWKTLAELRESFEDSDLPICVDVVDWSNCTERFRSIVAPQLVRISAT